MVGIGLWGSEIWLHEYLISPTEISVNWPGSKQLGTRPIYTAFNGVGLNRYSCDSCKIWCVRVNDFHHVPLKYGHENAKMQKQKFDDVTLRYSMY